uniref:FUN14 domain-containing protein 1 n=1 Tax=Romanomermis culicivorax TaxID=13658 RepID=A0A915J6D3_ROMCU
MNALSDKVETSECDHGYDIATAKVGSSSLYSLPADAIDKISKAPSIQQLAISGVAGCAVGYMGAKVGKLIALTIGMGIIGIQIASEKGYIIINWSRVQQSAKELIEENIDKVDSVPKSKITVDKGSAGAPVFSKSS